MFDNVIKKNKSLVTLSGETLSLVTSSRETLQLVTLSRDNCLWLLYQGTLFSVSQLKHNIIERDTIFDAS